jgi:uncharacterized membrane protein
VPAGRSQARDLVSLALGALLALLLGMVWLRRPADGAAAGRPAIDRFGRLGGNPAADAGSLGAVFALAGVGEVVGDLMARMIPDGSVS